jgi:hypothetical protein
VAEEVAEYAKLLRVIPFIGELHKKIERIRRQEVEKTLRRLAQPGAQVSEQIELLSRSLVRKILHEPPCTCAPKRTTAQQVRGYPGRLYNLSENGVELRYPGSGNETQRGAHHHPGQPALPPGPLAERAHSRSAKRAWPGTPSVW